MEAILLSQLMNGIGQVSKDCTVSSVVFDSRKVEENSVFLAIKGEKANGEDFAQQCIEKGACMVLTENLIPNVADDMQCVVTNILDASIKMGANFRKLYNNIKVIGVTGSVGKTSTKDFIYTALSPFAKTVRSLGNHNNELGMPQTIYTFTQQDRYAILEMGMSNFNDVHKLSTAAKPDYAVITCIGVSHIEQMKTQENILKAKLEICDGMGENGVLVLNGDDRYLRSAKIDNPKNIVYFAIDNKDAQIVAQNIVQSGFSTSFDIEDKKNGIVKCVIPAVGRHNVLNALSAYALVTAMGYDPVKTAENLANFVPSGMRQKVVKTDGITYIEDCYNASPDSMRAAICTLSSLKKTRAIAVLGDMLELGEKSDCMHYEVGEFAKGKNIDMLWCFGRQAQHICRGFGDGAMHFQSKEQLSEYAKNNLKEQDVVIFKASRGMAFEEIIQMVYEK